jgi:rubrerythrin
MEHVMPGLPAGYPEEAFAAFAFLKDRAHLSVDDLKVLALIECYGEAFYFRLADSVSLPEAKALLRRNGQEERGHAHRVLKTIRLKTGEPYELPADADNPFISNLPADVTCDTGIIGALEAGEADGDLTYQAWADNEPDAAIADLLRQNGREESRHGQRATEVRRLLSSA